MCAEHRVIFGNSRFLDKIEDNSIQLVVTSPPYWQLKDYDNREQLGFNQSYPEYIESLNEVWAECYRVLEPECRLCINIGDQFTRTDIYGRYKIIPIREEIIRFCEGIGFDYMGAIIWQKVTTCNTSGGASIMGSYPYPRNGILKLDYEFILLFKKLGKNKRKIGSDIKKASQIPKDEWNTLFNGHWYFPGEKQDEHIAMFPVELPKRLITMFTFKGETVLDPFLGSGSTVVAAMLTDRCSIGYEINSNLKDVILKKFYDHIDLTNSGRHNLTFDYQDNLAVQDMPAKYKKELPGILNSIGEILSKQEDTDGLHILTCIDKKLRILLDEEMEGFITEKHLDSIVDSIKSLMELHPRDRKMKKYCENGIFAVNMLKAKYMYVYENIVRLNTNYNEFKSVVSKVDREKKGINLIKVKDIISPASLLLSDDRVIKFSGVKPFENHTAALDYLKQYVLNKYVELNINNETKDGAFAFIKLKNKTHINAKLIKDGLCDVDIESAGKFKDRFLSYASEARKNRKGYWGL